MKILFESTVLKMECRHHVIITGTGRAGTTFLVELLTELGLETGFTSEQVKFEKDQLSNAGLELDVRDSDAPYIVKSPLFCDYCDEVLARHDITIDQLFVPMRDLRAAAESRRRVRKLNMARLGPWMRFRRWLHPKIIPGGPWGVKSKGAEEQEQVLLTKIYQLLLSVSQRDIPITFIAYPRLIVDGEYLYSKLGSLISEVSREDFLVAFRKIANPKMVNISEAKEWS